MITKRIIKNIVETFSGVEDIAIKNRKINIIDLRSVYYKLCRTFPLEDSNSFQSIGSLVNKHHASVLHSAKMFDSVYGTKYFTANDVYNKCYEKLCTMVDKEKDVVEFLDAVDLKQYYRIKHIRLVEKSHAAISLMQRNADRLNNNEFIKKILTLEASEIQELEIKFDNFFKVKAKLNENKNQKV